MVSGGGTPGSVNTVRTGHWLWVAVAALLWYIDRFTGFNGFPYSALTRIVDDPYMIWRIASSTVVIIAVALYLIFNWNNRDRKDLVSGAVVIVFFFVTALLFRGQLQDPGLIMHLLYGFLFWWILLRSTQEDKMRANLTAIMLVFLDFFLFSIVGQFAPSLDWFTRYTVPVWFIASLKFTPPFRWKSFIIAGVVITYILVFATTTTYAFQGNLEKLSQTDWENFKEFIRDAYENGRDLVTSVTRQAFVGAVGEEYYQGQIDQNAKERLGVYILGVAPSQTRAYYTNEPVTVSMDIEAKTLKDPIPITFSCKSGSTKGQMNPERLEVAYFDQTTVDCHFPEGLSEGRKEIEMDAEFSFETSSYRTGYFADIEEFRSRRQTPEEYLLSKGSPYKAESTITSGPLNVGMAIGNKIVLVDRDVLNENVRLAITLSITQGWEGEVKKVDSIILQLPSEFELREEGIGTDRYCNGKTFTRITCADIGEEGCEDNRYNLYKLESSSANIEKIGVTDGENLLCRVNILDTTQLFGEDDIDFTRKTFRVIVNYTHELNKKVGVTINKGESVRSNVPDCITVCDDSDGCYCPDGCEVEGGETIEKDQTCGFSGLTKENIGLPAVAACNDITACDAFSFTIGCDDTIEDKDKLAKAIYDGGKNVVVDEDNVAVEYGAGYKVFYNSLNSDDIKIKVRDGASVDKDDTIGTIEGDFQFSIQQNDQLIDAMEFYDLERFDFSGSCVDTLEGCGTCNNYNCLCGPLCTKKDVTVLKGQSCGVRI